MIHASDFSGPPSPVVSKTDDSAPLPPTTGPTASELPAPPVVSPTRTSSQPTEPYTRECMDDEQSVEVETPHNPWPQRVSQAVFNLNQLRWRLRQSLEQYQQLTNQIHQQQQSQQTLLKQIEQTKLGTTVSQSVQHVITPLVVTVGKVVYQGQDAETYDLIQMAIGEEQAKLDLVEQASANLKAILEPLLSANDKLSAELTENRQELKRRQQFDEHLLVLQKAKVTGMLEGLAALKPLKPAIARLYDADFDGVPNIGGQILISIAAKSGAYHQFSRLFDLGYRLIGLKSGLEDPMTYIVDKQAVSEMLSACGDRLAAGEYQALFEAYLADSLAVSPTIVTSDQAQVIDYLISHGHCQQQAKALFAALINETALPLNVRARLALSFFNQYMSFKTLPQAQRLTILTLIDEQYGLGKKQQVVSQFYIANQKHLDGQLLLEDFEQIGQAELAESFILAFGKPLARITERLFTIAYQAHLQANSQMLRQALQHEHTRRDIKNILTTLQAHPDIAQIKFELATLKPDAFDDAFLISTMSERACTDIVKDFNLLFEQTRLANSTIDAVRLSTRFLKAQLPKLTEPYQLMPLVEQIEMHLSDNEVYQEHKAIMLKMIKNQLLEALIKGEIKADEAMSEFLASHRTQGWSCLCGLIKLPATFLQTPSSRIYDAIRTTRLDNARAELDSQQQRAEQDYQALYAQV